MLLRNGLCKIDDGEVDNMNTREEWKLLWRNTIRIFSKRSNLHNDDAAKRRRFRGIIGGLIMLVICVFWACILLDCVYIEYGRQLLIWRG